MLRKFLIPTVIVSILILLTTLTTITKATAVTTSPTLAKTPTTTTKTNTTTLPPSIVTAVTATTTTASSPTTPAQNSATVFQLRKTSSLLVKKFLNNNNHAAASNSDEETTTSLLPLQPPLNVTSTTLASFILNQKHQQEQRERLRKQQQLLYVKQQRQQRQQQRQQQQQQQQQQKHRQVQDVVRTSEKQEPKEETKKQEPVLKDEAKDKNVVKKKDLDTAASRVEIITAPPSSTHAYIPFDLDYNDPTEERSLQESNSRKSTINEVLSNLFPKGFSDIFRFSYNGPEETPTTTEARPAIKIIRSTPAPFRPMPSTFTQRTPVHKEPTNTTIVTVSTSVTRETRREVRPGHTEIVVEKIITDPSAMKSSEEFRDGSNSISKDELLRINRAAKEASVLPSLLVDPKNNSSRNQTNAKVQEPIIILNEGNSNDDFVEAPEDDNQIAESRDVPPQIIAAPQSESTSFHATPSHQYNLRIIHDNPEPGNDFRNPPKPEEERSGPSYQSFVEQSKYMQNSLQEAPSRKFLKNFQKPVFSDNASPPPVNKGNFHYEQSQTNQNHIQSVPPAAQLQYRQQQPQQLHTKAIESTHLRDSGPRDTEQYFYQGLKESDQQAHAQQQLHTEIISSKHLRDISPKDVGQYDFQAPKQQSPQKQLQVHYEELQNHFKNIQHPGNAHGYKTGIDQENEAQHYQNYRDSPSESVQSQHNQQQHSDQYQQYQIVSDKDLYHIHNDQKEEEHTTAANIVFVTINTPTAQRSSYVPKYSSSSSSQKAEVVRGKLLKSPHEFVAEAAKYIQNPQQHEVADEVDHQAQQSENNPKPSDNGYTFVEVQKSINIHNKLITEKDGHLVEQHETFYPQQKFRIPQQYHSQEYEPQHHQGPTSPSPSPDYVSLSENPIQVEEQYESAASLRDEQHTYNPPQDLGDLGTIQQSHLVQETHVQYTPLNGQHQHAQGGQVKYVEQAEPHHQGGEGQVQYVTQEEHHQGGGDAHHHHQEEENHVQYVPQNEHYHGEPINVVDEQNLSGETSGPAEHVSVEHNHQVHNHHAHAHGHPHPVAVPMVLQEIVEKHIPVPYGVPEPVGIPVHIEHYIDRPYPIETIVEKPVPYPVEKVVEKVVEKHVPVEVEKIVEKPVEVVVKKYIDRPVAIPIKIPVALHLPPPPPPQYGSHSSYGHSGLLYPPPYGGLDHASTWPQTVNGASFARIPQNVLKSYYTKMLKKLVPQMQKAYKNSQSLKSVNTKATPLSNSYKKPSYKISDMLYDLKPPPLRSKPESNWDVGARYQYDYNTLPSDLSVSSSINVGKNAERSQGQGYKTNFDEFQRWRNGHSLKRSPDFGRNLHVEYGFKPPLVPSVEIDDKGVPLKAAADLANGKEE